MNSKQRLQAVLNGQIPDRVPISTYELVAFNSQAFENKEPSYAELMRAIREKTDCICMWEPASNETFLASSSPVEIQVTKTRADDAVITQKILPTPKGDITQVTKLIDNVHTVWEVEHWCKNLEDVDRALSVPYEPLEFETSDLARIKNELGDNGIIMSSLADPLWLAAALMNFGDYTVWALTETDHFAQAVACMHDRNMENLKRMLATNLVDLYRICGPEYATPPYLPPHFFQQFVVPYVTEMVDLIHSKGAKARFHCHGRLEKVLDMILATGSDALDPCEAPPDGDISLDQIKQRIGSKMCIMGNLQLKLLEQGSQDQVAQAVKQCMQDAKQSGRFVIMPTAAPINIPLADKTKDNYLCFIDTALEYGEYE